MGPKWARGRQGDHGPNVCEGSQHRRVGHGRKGGHGPKVREGLQNQRVGPGRQGGHGPKVYEGSRNRRVVHGRKVSKCSKTQHLCSGSDRQGRFGARTVRTFQAHYRNLRVDNHYHERTTSCSWRGRNRTRLIIRVSRWACMA